MTRLYTLDDDYALYEYINRNHTIDSKTHYVSHLLPFIFDDSDAEPVEGVHYAIKRRGQPVRKPILMARSCDLEAGDIIIMGHKVVTLTPDMPILRNTGAQGYYVNRIVGGAKYDAFCKDHDSVADWKRGAGQWFFNKRKFERSARK